MIQEKMALETRAATTAKGMSTTEMEYFAWHLCWLAGFRKTAGR